MIVMKLWYAVEQVVKGFLILLVTAMVSATLAQVFWRYVFNDPLIWSEELARYLFVWIAYLSAWLTWRHRAHIALDAVTYLRSPVLEMWSARIVEVLVLGFCAWTFHANFRLLGLTVDQPSAVLELPMVYVYAAYNVMTFMICGDILVNWLMGALASRSVRVPA
ncbi:C4-dicarboxylate ABC transporter [Skermanella stibiiresistens SB22]|uniref:TRAP transporter small permease protein n=1 Tax=Skermanella stibiiresistens SB22 TaxID=1385369 RepID=W9HB00_9PROT|nr:TRAP transporter small permease [Skermanella stibiiresistens]EWY41043.1 C4-dicarboxylate ABC transporter [Skermanella stibiiresistens SB22]